MTNYTLWADRGTGSGDIYKIAEHLKKFVEMFNKSI